MSQYIGISAADVEAMDLTDTLPFVAWHPDSKFFLADREHYRLLAYLARKVTALFPGSPVVDIGSHLGHSAAALRAGAAAASVVHTFDHGVTKALPPDALAFARANGIVVNGPHADALDELAKFVKGGCMLVALDPEPHDGVYERKVIQALMDCDFTGLLVLDETRLNEQMRHLLNWAPVKKIDVTSVAHWSGTAVLVFDPAKSLDCALI